MFSGGLDSTYLLFRLKDMGFTNIHAVAVDVGDPVNETELRRTAASFGAKFARIEGKALFVENGVRPAIRAHARYLGNYPLSSSLSRPVIAGLVADYARQLGSDLLLHTANLSQNSLPRLNNSLDRLGFRGQYGSPYEHSAISRERKAAELADVGLAFMTDRRLSGDENLWCREFESGPLDDPEDFHIPEDAFRWTRKRAGLGAERLSLSFERGNLVAVDGNPTPLSEAIPLLNEQVGKFGHGRFVGLEHISSGDKVLEVREAPAAMIIMDALRHLEVASLDTDAVVLKKKLEQDWVQEAVSGRWGSTLHEMCGEAIASALMSVGGTVAYNIDTRRFLPRSIIADAPRYIRDRDFWEFKTASSRVFSVRDAGA